MGIIFFIYMDTQGHAIYRSWIHLFPSSFVQGEKKNHLVLAEIEPKSSRFTSIHSILWTMPPQAVLFSGHVKTLTMDSSSDGDDEDEGDDNDRTSRRHRETLISVTEDLTSTSTSTTKAPTKVERKGYRRRHRPSISFEDSVPTAPRQRLKQLQFLRTVHSAQARLVIFYCSTSLAYAPTGFADSCFCSRWVRSIATVH